jgi:hypothetical protein
MAFVQHCQQEAESQGPEAGFPPTVTKLAVKSPETKEILEAVGHHMESFPENRVDGAHMAPFNERQPGEEPPEKPPGVLGGT